MVSPVRRRILCIRPRLNESAGTILTVTSNEWVEALSLHADVTAIEHDFDLEAVCRTVEPHLIVLDAVNFTRPGPLAIANPKSRPDIPRILFLNSDPHDPARVLTLRMAEELGITTVFVTGEAYRQHLPGLAHFRCYFVPQFIDDAVYRDYGLEKTIPVSIFSVNVLDGFYPWRARLAAEMPDILPTMVFPHPGYLKGRADPFAVQGEAYARQLSRSRFAVADTTRLDYGVRKHIEIPACGAVLVAPESDALASYGFVDRENCLLGEGPDLYEAIRAVARDPARYEHIRRSGMRLAGRYTRAGWRLMLDWLDCHDRCGPGETVQQQGWYGPFRPARAGAPSLVAAVQRDSAMSAMLRRAQAAILTGHDLPAGEAAAGTAAGWIGHVAEPQFLLGMLHLLQGRPLEAAQAIYRRSRGQASIDPQLGDLDPVETAWLLLIAVTVGDRDVETAMRQEAAAARHLGLRRVLWLIDGQPHGPALDPGLLDRQPGDQTSVCWLGEEDFTVWCDLVGRVLAANGHGLHDALAKLRPHGDAQTGVPERSVA